MTTWSDTANFAILSNGSVENGSVVPALWNFSTDDTGTGLDDFAKINESAATAIDVTQNAGNLTIDTTGVSKWRNGFFSVPGLKIASALSGDFDIQFRGVDYPGNANYENQRIGFYVDTTHGAWVGRQYATGHSIGSEVINAGDNYGVGYAYTPTTFSCRLTRVSNVFHFYVRDLDSDSWSEVGSGLDYTLASSGDFVICAENYNGTAFTAVRFDYAKIVAGGSFSAESLIRDSGVMYLYAGSGYAHDFSTLSVSSTGSPTVKFKYASYASDQGWTTKAQVDANATWNDTWLSVAELAATENIDNSYLYLKAQITGNASQSLDSVTINTYAIDVTPPAVPTSTKFALFETDNYAMIWVEPEDADFSHCELRRDVDGTTKYLQDDFTWDTGSTSLASFCDGGTGCDYPRSNYIDEDVVGTSVAYYVRSVDAIGNASSWTAFEEGSGSGSILDDTVYWGVDDDGDYYPLETPLPLNYPTEENVLDGVVFGYDDQYEGTAISGTRPDEPIVHSAVASAGSATVALSLNDADDPAYIIYSPVQAQMTWSQPSESLKSTDGSAVAVTGLNNLIEYEFSALSKNGGVYSHPGSSVRCVPRSSAQATGVRMRDDIAASALRVAKRQGVEVYFYADRSTTTPTAIWITADSGSASMGLLDSTVTDVESMQVTIPRQTGFPPSGGIANGASIVINDHRFDIERAEPDRGVVEISSSFSCSLRRYRTLSEE